VRYFEQFPEVVPFGQRGSFHNKVRPARRRSARCLPWTPPDRLPGDARRANMLRLLQAEWIVDLTTRADREGKHAEYANRYDRSELKQANLKELNMQIDRGYRVRARRAPRLDAPPLPRGATAYGWQRARR